MLAVIAIIFVLVTVIVNDIGYIHNTLGLYLDDYRAIKNLRNITKNREDKYTIIIYTANDLV